MKKEINKEEKQDSKEKEAKVFFDLNQNIINKEKQRRLLMIQNIEAIAQMFDKKLYKIEFEEFAGFLGQLEVYYTRTEVYRHLNIKKRLLDEFKFDPETIYDIAITRLEAIAKFSKDKSQAKELIGEARVLTSRDWREKMNEVRGKPLMKDCKHKWNYYNICKICGLKIKNESVIEEEKKK